MCELQSLGMKMFDEVPEKLGGFIMTVEYSITIVSVYNSNYCLGVQGY